MPAVPLPIDERLPPPGLLIVGELAAGAAGTVCSSLALAEQIVAAAESPPAVIAVEQRRPGEIPPAAVERLRSRAPLARIVAVLSSWCESDARSGRPWPGVPRVFAHQWPVRSVREFEALAEGRPSSWALPPTATIEEQFLVAQPPPRLGGVAAVASEDRTVAEWLADALSACGTDYVSLSAMTPRTTDATALVFDACEADGPTLARLRSLAEQFARVPRVLLLNYPRPDDVRRARDAGATNVLGKPLFLADLWHALTR